MLVCKEAVECGKGGRGGEGNARGGPNMGGTERRRRSTGRREECEVIKKQNKKSRNGRQRVVSRCRHEKVLVGDTTGEKGAWAGRNMYVTCKALAAPPAQDPETHVCMNILKSVRGSPHEGERRTHVCVWT